jgi:outer membrane protein OmpA-like peptidoglycan-associated protein
VIRKAPDGRLLRLSSSIGSFYYHSKESDISLKAKLLSDDAGIKQPLNEAFVHIHSGGNNDTLAKATTDKYGDFEVLIPNNEKDYIIKANPKDKNTKSVLLVTQEGVVISKFDKKSPEFEYKLMKADLLELSDLKVSDDISLAFKKMKSSDNNPTIIIENIIYGLLKYTIDQQSLGTLNKVVTILNENPKLKLEVVSHTDSQGDDNFNLNLSEKRARAVIDYLIQKGIDAGRLKAIGRGETEIRNRCNNDISCSDKEHAYNRRTEFKFTK